MLNSIRIKEKKIRIIVCPTGVQVIQLSLNLTREENPVDCLAIPSNASVYGCLQGKNGSLLGTLMEGLKIKYKETKHTQTTRPCKHKAEIISYFYFFKNELITYSTFQSMHPNIHLQCNSLTFEHTKSHFQCIHCLIFTH